MWRKQPANDANRVREVVQRLAGNQADDQEVLGCNSKVALSVL